MCDVCGMYVYIQGTPIELEPSTEYTISATNTGGTSTYILDLTIIDYPPTDLFYNDGQITLLIDSEMTEINPTWNGMYIHNKTIKL